MSVFIGILLFVVLIGSIGYGYYLDYKRDKKPFVSDLKSVLKRLTWCLAAVVIWLGVEKANEIFLPVYSNYGIEFNEQREDMGIPLIPIDWQELGFISRQYEKWYGSPKRASVKGHYKKLIEFNYWHAITEEDYYQNQQKGEGLIATYNYKSHKHEYFMVLTSAPIDITLIIRSSDEQVRTSITKERFDQILNSWKKEDVEGEPVSISN